MSAHFTETLRLENEMREMISEWDQAHEVVDLLRKEKKEAEEKLLARTEENNRLKAKLETLKKENHELNLHLIQAEGQHLDWDWKIKNASWRVLGDHA